MRRHPAPIALVAISATLLWAVTVAAQGEVPDASPTSAGAKTIEVVGVEYAFVGLPTAVGTGTQLVFVNTGAEFHELAVGRIDEDSDATLEELVELGAAAFTEGTVEILPEGPLVANPAETAQGTLTSPLIWPCSLTTRTDLEPFSALTLPLILPSRCRPPWKLRSPSTSIL